MTQHNTSQQRLIKAAEKMEISVNDKQKDWIQDIIEYSKDGKTEVVYEGINFGSNSAFSEMICDDRHIAKQLLADAGIAVPRGIVFKLDSEDFDSEALRKLAGGFMEEGKTYVCRPAYGTGRFAQRGTIKSLDDLELHLDQYIDEFATWLLEEAHSGSSLEMLVIGGKACGAIVREEFGLLGDGESSLEELMDAHNAEAAEADIIEINADTRQWMRDQDVFLSDVVPEGQRIILAGGDESGHALDVLANLHADYALWAEKIATILNRPVFMLEISTSAPEDAPDANAMVMDINGQVDWSQFKEAGDEDDQLANSILEYLFS